MTADIHLQTGGGRPSELFAHCTWIKMIEMLERVTCNSGGVRTTARRKLKELRRKLDDHWVGF
jgi:hypothetical protein